MHTYVQVSCQWLLGSPSPARATANMLSSNEAADILGIAGQ
jgi:hypothetical protein